LGRENYAKPRGKNGVALSVTNTKGGGRGGRGLPFALDKDVWSPAWLEFPPGRSSPVRTDQVANLQKKEVLLLKKENTVSGLFFGSSGL